MVGGLLAPRRWIVIASVAVVASLIIAHDVRMIGTVRPISRV